MINVAVSIDLIHYFVVYRIWLPQNGQKEDIAPITYTTSCAKEDDALLLWDVLDFQ